MRCQVCNSSNNIQAHHRTYDTHGREHLHMNDLVVLCEICHGLFHGHSNTSPVIRQFVVRPKREKIPRVAPHLASDIVIPEGNEIILTKQLIDSCRANGAFTNATLRGFGLKRPTLEFPVGQLGLSEKC